MRWVARCAIISTLTFFTNPLPYLCTVQGLNLLSHSKEDYFSILIIYTLSTILSDSYMPASVSIILCTELHGNVPTATDVFFIQQGREKLTQIHDQCYMSRQTRTHKLRVEELADYYIENMENSLFTIHPRIKDWKTQKTADLEAFL